VSHTSRLQKFVKDFNVILEIYLSSWLQI